VGLTRNSLYLIHKEKQEGIVDAATGHVCFKGGKRRLPSDGRRKKVPYLAPYRPGREEDEVSERSLLLAKRKEGGVSEIYPLLIPMMWGKRLCPLVSYLTKGGRDLDASL